MNPDTDRWVRSDEARNKLRDLLDEVTRGGAHVYVLRYDKPEAVIVPVGWYEEMRAVLADHDIKAGPHSEDTSKEQLAAYRHADGSGEPQ